jgi:aspartyl/glutamyl-tRNA(Asn/Gln) amidotransferase C subunit
MIQHLAKLSRLTLSEEEAKEFQQQFEEILTHFATIKQLKGKRQPLIPAITTLREDNPSPSNTNIINTFSATKDRFMKAPKTKLKG